MSIPAIHRSLSFKEYKEQVARILMMQEEDVAFPSTAMIKAYWIEGKEPHTWVYDWISYCLAHSREG